MSTLRLHRLRGELAERTFARLHARTTIAWIAVPLLAWGLTFCAGRPVVLSRPAPRPPEPAVLPEAVRDEALPLIAAGDYLGLGEEARRLLALWPGSVSGMGLDPERRCLRSPAGDETPLSGRMADALDRLAGWYGLIPATLSRPIAPEELREGALHVESIARIAALFEDSIRRGVRVEGSWVFPETGGEATLDGALHLWSKPDATWSTVREIALRIEDRAALVALYEERAADMGQLDPYGLLKRAIDHFDGENPGTLRALRMAAVTVTKNAAESYSLTPAAQFSLVVGTVWRGRYVGRWHTHSPHHDHDGWRGGDVPSFEDMQNAVADGQFLTVAFQPDGFDLYDAAPLGEAGRADLSLLKIVRYRSPAWRERFAALHASLPR